MKTSEQLELDLRPTGDADVCRLVLTRPLAGHRMGRRVLARINYVLRFFPELKARTIRIGLTRSASGMAVPGGREIWFNPAAISYHTIAHELIHLLQGEIGIPKGERSCDLYSLARHWTLNDTPPCYLTIPRRLIDKDGGISPWGAKMMYASALECIRLRGAGMRNYIVHFERRLEKLSSCGAIEDPDGATCLAGS